MTKIIQDVNLGTNIQRFRKEKGLTQEQMCAKLELSGRPMIQSTYAQIETGVRNIFTSDLIAITRILGVNFNEMFSGLEPINKYEIESQD
ncbi:hypothetical protein GCM10023142_23290 [Anaerocolumna aminovalerica]|uniref:Helix-turn-helix domain-containing protein n=1 Tax=Anaerocolumna aminovalerica TaxID=1527 RepID=A0A1I5GKL1_9FIRM|nr:helix-turn-helix transcriptional regulator [Anaerocolumna aminovalerica]MBU5334394.1 helix-turn-helix domain-containing protein [Anaerocolumna aminovalerica]SFO36101.1 Helix-turn-helix domain-containing protein [Anaerocolumna aminovalerica]